MVSIICESEKETSGRQHLRPWKNSSNGPVAVSNDLGNGVTREIEEMRIPCTICPRNKWWSAQTQARMQLQVFFARKWIIGGSGPSLSGAK
jgi:hypothetical protein